MKMAFRREDEVLSYTLDKRAYKAPVCRIIFPVAVHPRIRDH